MITRNRNYARRARIGNRRNRRGTALVAALVCLLIVMAILGQMLRGTLSARRQLQVERDARQTELLLQAGANRAAFQLSRAASYRGETWKLPAEAIIGRGEGQVTIEATRTADGRPWQIKVVAEYPLGRESSIRRTRTFSISPQSAQAQE